MRRRTLLALLPTPALAQGGQASRPVRMVIPFTTGGSNDIIGRILAEGMSARLGQPIVVENRGGAGGILGNDAVAKAAPDGLTVLLAGSGSFVISGLVAARLPYDVERDFAAIGLLGASPNIIAADPRLGVGDLAGLRRVAGGRGTPLTFASPGAGTTAHALGAMMALVLGLELEFVHYRGTAPALQDVLGGRVQLISNAAAPFLPHLVAGTLRGLAVAGQRRSPVVPGLATSAEQGFGQLDSATWYGLVAPAGTPEPVLARLHGAMNATLADPAVARRLAEQGCDVEASGSPAAFAGFLASERRRWAEVVQRAGLREG